ncbi:lipase member M-like isoform X1 [Eublepharis macularius]|uniref:Lipase n=1 Tax=Eublepharis macularius TaxID=481883 RepID=A0AA97JIL7_EUBMA|nr:lipase member M-like isoform X1 [Eublepharis macularius]
MWLFIAAACLIQEVTVSEGLITNRHLNPQEFMTIGEIIQYWGYCNEEYEILTEDGYYLQINRIPYGIHSPGKKGPKPAVLLVHGLMMEGRLWLANLPRNSLGFVLADAGYDVWILNIRGSTWSRRHQTLSIDQEKFWDFSFHEMGIYDIPAAINFILRKTQQEGLYYIGFSQGGTIGFISFSTMPDLAQKVKLFITLSPGYSLTNSSGLLFGVVLIPEGVRKLIWGNREYCIFSNKLKNSIAKFCSCTVMDRLCLQLISLCFGNNEKNLNVSRADVYLGIYPDFTSVKTISHWGQIAISNEFKYFDYGSKNRDIYNMNTPPFYRIEDMTVPTAVWSAGEDIAVDETDTELLLPRIRNLIFYKNIPDWQHMDYVWGLDAPQCLYPDILGLMQKYK